MKTNKRGDIVAQDWKFTGQEPKWGDWEKLSFLDYTSRLNSALKFYNYYCDAKDYRSWICDWMKANKYSKDDISLIKSANNAGIPVSAGKLIRMLNRGMPNKHPEGSWSAKTKIQDAIQNSLRYLYQNEASKNDVDDKPSKPKSTLTPHERVIRRVNAEVISELDKLIDEIVEMPAKTTPAKIPSMNLASLLKNTNTPRNGVKYVVDWIQEFVDELTKAKDKTCPDAVEGYGYFSVPQLRRLINNFEKMIAEAKAYGQMKVSTRKTRTPKSKPAEKQVARLKYAASSDEYGLTSLEPTRIPYAQVVALFNAKTRRLAIYKAKGSTGLSVKGSTIKDFNPDESFIVAVRKPGDVLPAIISGNEKKISQKLKTIKTKKYPANGRVNDKTLIIRAID